MVLKEFSLKEFIFCIYVQCNYCNYQVKVYKDKQKLMIIFLLFPCCLIKKKQQDFESTYKIQQTRAAHYL